MKLVKRYQTKNERYKDQVYIKNVKGIMVHEIATNQEDPLVFVKGWNKSPISKAVHAFVGNGIVYETLPCDPGKSLSGWHCGGSGNRSYISFEMCESRYYSWPKPYIAKSRNITETNKFTNAVYKTAVEYCAYKCKQFGWNPLDKGRIISHKEGNAMGIASNHSDPDSVWKTVTNADLTMDKFRKDVAALMKVTKKKQENKKKETKEQKMVKGLQTALNKDYKEGLAVDGSYGPKTKAALKQHNIKKDSKKTSVKWLQTQLIAFGCTDANNKKLDVDGDFGPKTLAALKKLQKKLKVSQDGEFGTGTMDKFIKLF
ncbi:MAG: N-acetylmuramoyl-L-alanine amidase [bacterium]|nr:N-acetylmuramoyl-L-alanine amidase [bacterium]